MALRSASGKVMSANTRVWMLSAFVGARLQQMRRERVPWSMKPASLKYAELRLGLDRVRVSTADVSTTDLTSIQDNGIVVVRYEST
jgi:hypothetical protein